MDHIGLVQLAAAVFVGNILTLSVFYSLRSFWNYDEHQKLSWPQAAGFFLPLLFVLSALLTALP
jgi:uncharacterized membrane protein